MNPAPQETLRDVRHAYRLLHDYQRLIIDSLRFIGIQLGFQYAGGWCRFCDGSPRQGGGNLKNWAWDWLGLYFHEFRFISEDKCLSAFHMPDTAALKVPYIERDETAGFPPADQSSSIVAFVYAAHSEDWNVESFKENPKPLFTTEQAEMELGNGMQLKQFNMDQLFTEASALQIIDELRSAFGLNVPQM